MVSVTPLPRTLHSSEMPAVKVLTTSPSLASVIKAVGGDRVSVESLIPPGIDPHDYEPPESVLIDALQSAEIVFLTGPSHLPIEIRISELKDQGVIDVEVVDYHDYVQAGLALLENPKTGLPNPHGYLFSISGLVAVAKTAARYLSMMDPEGSNYYSCRLSAYLYLVGDEGNRLKGSIPEGFRVGLVSPILQYVVKDIGINVTYVLLADVTAEPTEADITRMKELYDSGELSMVLVSDTMISKNPKIYSVLRSSGIPYGVVPVSELTQKPELIPASVVTAIINARGQEVVKPSVSTSLLVAGVVSEAIVILGLVYLLHRWKKVVISALSR